MKNDQTLLETHIIQPTTTPVASVIWLHGLGADNSDFAPIVPEMRLPSALPIRFVFPNAPMLPVTINNGYIMRAWYDIVSLKIDDHADKQGITTSVESLNHLIAAEEKLGIPSEKIILAGFSQGAVIALTAGLTYPKKLGGILALSGYLPFADDILKNAPTINQSIPIFLGHGTQDTVVPFFLGQATYDALHSHHRNVVLQSYPMAHSVCEDEILDIREWLITTLRNQ